MWFLTMGERVHCPSQEGNDFVVTTGSFLMHAKFGRDTITARISTRQICRQMDKAGSRQELPTPPARYHDASGTMRNSNNRTLNPQRRV